MKKYQQLLIVSLGLVSFICFLIYKHEYDRLRNVLEVLEVFGTPPSPGPGQYGVHRSHPLDVNHNPALGAGSINELNLGGGAGVHRGIYGDAKQDPAAAHLEEAFLSKNGHGVKPPDNEEGGGGEDKKTKTKADGAQNPAAGSGEVVDNMIDDGGGGGEGVFGKLGALKANKKSAQRQDSIFKEKLQEKEQDNEV